MKEDIWLYDPPKPGLDSPEKRAWHQRMSSLFVFEPKMQIERVMYRALRQRGIVPSEMGLYGIQRKAERYAKPELVPGAYSRVFDHGRVLRRKADSRLFVLGEPYRNISGVDTDSAALLLSEHWRAIGAEVAVSPDTGWLPGRTISILIGMPEPVAKKKAAKPALIPSVNYSRNEAAEVCGVAVMTLIRAFEAGNLKAYRVGRRVIHSGQQLLDWLESGKGTKKAKGGAK